MALSFEGMTVKEILDKHQYRADLLHEAALDAADHKEQFCMRTFLGFVKDKDFAGLDIKEPELIENYTNENHEPLCGTAMCLAGWVVHNANKFGEVRNGRRNWVEDTAYQVLECQFSWVENELHKLFTRSISVSYINADNVVEYVELFITSGFEALSDHLYKLNDPSEVA